MITEKAQSLAFLNGGGQMGELIRAKDWSITPLGVPETWPQSLRTPVSILLNSQFPMFLWWGKDLITFYNDAYINVAGKKHPSLLGKSGKAAWEEIWTDLGPLVDSVFKGKSTWSEDQPLVMNRQGYYEETFFTFSYSPIFDELGEVCALFCACIETTEKVKAAEKILKSEQNLRSTILQAPVAMCILRGPLFVVEIANSRMYELWGRPEQLLMNKPIFDGLPEARDQGIEELIQHVYKTGETFTAYELPVNLPREEGIKTIYLNFVYQPFRESDGAVSGIIAVATDVTEQVLARLKIEEIVVQRTRQLANANESLMKTNEELKQSNINLAEFAYAASHDLKEPARKLHLFTDRLKNSLSDRLKDSEIHFFERMQAASTRMISLIDDLLTYSEVGEKRQEAVDIDLDDVLQQVISDLDLEIEQRNALIHVDKLFKYNGFKRQLQQAFHNLIVNGLKYSKPGLTPVIRINYTIVPGESVPLHLNAEERAAKFYKISVTDNGTGFGQEDAERIFNVFTRLHEVPEVTGTGVGLSIVRKVMQNHNGYVWAYGKKDEGATFNLLLPFQGKD